MKPKPNRRCPECGKLITTKTCMACEIESKSRARRASAEAPKPRLDPDQVPLHQAVIEARLETVRQIRPRTAVEVKASTPKRPPGRPKGSVKPKGGEPYSQSTRRRMRNLIRVLSLCQILSARRWGATLPELCSDPALRDFSSRTIRRDLVALHSIHCVKWDSNPMGQTVWLWSPIDPIKLLGATYGNDQTEG